MCWRRNSLFSLPCFLYLKRPSFLFSHFSFFYEALYFCQNGDQFRRHRWELGGHFDLLRTLRSLKGLYCQEKSHERVISVPLVRELIDGLTAAPRKHRGCSGPQCRPPGRRDLWLWVSGQEMEWKGNITAEISSWLCKLGTSEDIVYFLQCV